MTLKLTEAGARGLMPEATSVYIYILLKSELPAPAPYPGAMEGSGFTSTVYGRKPGRSWKHF